MNNNAYDCESASQAENPFAITQNNPAEKDTSNDDSGGDNPFENDSTGNDSLESMRNIALESTKNRSQGLTELVASVPRKSRNFSRTLRRQWKPKVLHRGMEIEADSGYAISPLSGLQQKLYFMSSYATPIMGVEVIDFGGMKIIPIGKSDSPSRDAIASGSGTRLARFNLAYSGESIAGIQDVFRSTDELETETTSHWLGQETETVKQTVSEKTVHGSCTTHVWRSRPVSR
ncbi:MAG: hypothetical protein ACI87E_004133 [Mariniblastus sp.]